MLFWKSFPSTTASVCTFYIIWLDSLLTCLEYCLQKSAFHRCQTLEYKNGFRVPRHPVVGTEEDLDFAKQLIQPEMSDVVFESVAVPSKLTDEDQEEGFIPFFVALDKKVRWRQTSLGLPLCALFFNSASPRLCRCFASTRISRRVSCSPLRKTTVSGQWLCTTTLKTTPCPSSNPKCRTLDSPRGCGSNANVYQKMTVGPFTCGRISTSPWIWWCTESSTALCTVTLSLRSVTKHSKSVASNARVALRRPFFFFFTYFHCCSGIPREEGHRSEQSRSHASGPVH